MNEHCGEISDVTICHIILESSNHFKIKGGSLQQKRNITNEI